MHTYMHNSRYLDQYIITMLNLSQFTDRQKVSFQKPTPCFIECITTLLIKI